MYAFVEKWIPELLGIQYEKYPLSDGVEAAIIYEDDFKKLMRILVLISRTDNNNTGVYEIRANVNGMRIVLMKYWDDESILFSLTDGDIKNTEQFMHFMNLPTPRFNYDQFKALLLDGWRRNITSVNQVLTLPNTELIQNRETVHQADVEAVLGIANTSFLSVNDILEAQESVGEIVKPTQEAVIADEICHEPVKIQISEEDKIKANGKDFINEIRSLYDMGDLSIDVSDNDNIVITTGDSNSKVKSLLIEIAQKINKNIIFTKYSIPKITNYVKKQEPSEIFKHTIIFDVYPGCSYNTALFMNETHAGKVPNYQGTSCLGEKLRKLYIVKGSNVNSEIRKINEDRSLTGAKKEELIKNITDNRLNSPFFKYDCIFKDTYTNNIFAVKQKCTIYILFNYWEESFELLSVCLKEIARRINKNIPYEELLKIDKAYFDKLANNNLDEYVNFAVDSSKEVYNETLDNLRQEQENFKKYSDALMNCAKQMQKFQDMINAFDTGMMASKEKEKATATYIETLKINKISTMYIESGTIHIFTKNLYAKDTRTKKYHDIGTFHILIGMLNSSYDANNTVRIFNTKYGGMGMNNKFQAPHVWDDGHICHGNLITSMTEAYKNRNLFDLVYQIIIFLETANVADGAGLCVDTWPEVSNEEALGQEENKDIIFMYDKQDEAEQAFDDMLADSLPINIKG
jgi:uncharacterized protein YdcH (DUF465 family)